MDHPDTLVAVPTATPSLELFGITEDLRPDLILRKPIGPGVLLKWLASRP